MTAVKAGVARQQQPSLADGIALPGSSSSVTPGMVALGPENRLFMSPASQIPDTER